MRVQGGDERIDERLDQPVGDADDERRRKERREVRREDREQVPPMWPAAASVASVRMPSASTERAAEQDREAEAPERGAGNPSDFDLAQAEHRFEVAHDVAADGKRHGGGDERDAAGAEEMGRHRGGL